MSDIFETTEKANKNDWHSNKEMNPAANSTVTDEGLLESGDQDGDKTWREEKKETDTFSNNKKSFHPSDKLY